MEPLGIAPDPAPAMGTGTPQNPTGFSQSTDNTENWDLWTRTLRWETRGGTTELHFCSFWNLVFTNEAGGAVLALNLQPQMAKFLV